jgi:hypothetical protein
MLSGQAPIKVILPENPGISSVGLGSIPLSQPPLINKIRKRAGKNILLKKNI